MARERFERGAVVAYQGRTWIVWAYQRARYAEPFALPVVAQTRPLHRSHVRLDLGSGPLVVHVLDRQQIVAAYCLSLGQLDDAQIAQIAQTIGRAIEVHTMEQLHRFA
jgi:hypothetical protein